MIEKLIGARKARQCYRLIRHFKVTFLCLLLTILVLRGTIGAGKFGTPEQDFIKIRNRFASRKLSQPHREAQFDYNALFVDDVDSLGSISLSNHSLGPEVVNWDETRQNLLINGSKFGGKMRKPRVLVVTGSSENPCENTVGDHLLLKSIKNKIDYCRFHEMEIYYNVALLDAEMNGFWSKLPFVRSLLVGHPEAEFLWWMDSDALFTDMSFEVPWERYEGYNLVMHGWSEMVFEEKNWVGLNTGSFLIRNCQWSFDLLDSWAVMGRKGKVRVESGKILTNELKGRPVFEADDQSAMVYLLSKEKEKWGGKVYLENEYYLHGYWGILVNRFEEMMKNYHPGFGDHRWPLVTHFVGCKPCAKSGDYPVDRCLKQMERAFNFADNQVLRLYGDAHTSLDSKRVKRIQNETES